MKRYRVILSGIIGVVFLGVSVFVGYYLSLQGRIYQNVFVSSINIGKLTPDQAYLALVEAFRETDDVLEVVYKEVEIGTIKVTSINRDFRWVVDQAYSIGRSGNFFVDLKTTTNLLFNKTELELPISIEREILNDITETVAGKIDIDPLWPVLKKNSGKYIVVEGTNGLSLNRGDFEDKVKRELSVPTPSTINLSVETINTKVDLEMAEAAVKTLNEWGDKKISLRYKDFNTAIAEEDISWIIGLNGDYLNQINLSNFIEEIAAGVEKEPRDAVFEFVDGRVKEFAPEVVGVVVDRPKLALQIENAIREKVDSVEIAVINEQPKIKAGDINSFGISELIAVGKSSFGHSIPGRVFNVNLAASRINGVIVAPGEEFSFNKSVGEISRQTGYQTAYVISQGKTVLGDGGGVCQVSTTVFRAALDFGFPITERRAHAYRVGYYEQDSSPGIDATIFSPTTDFKFKNDTGNHILIQTKVDTKNLTMRVEIYGTHDGRKSTVSKPVITSQTPAPATEYVQDPTLPKGTTKQIDWAAAGAKVNFDYKVERGGEILFERKFVSSYQPWRAVYLVGTGQ